jgi:hypothetical protein
MTYRPMTYRPEDWKPGDVAMVTLSEDHPLGPVTLRGMRASHFDRELVWRLPDTGFLARDTLVESARPLVVLDPESDEDVERLADAFANHGDVHARVRETLLESARDTLRALARPPKPAEPTGLGAVVEQDGLRWVRADTDDLPWRVVAGPETSAFRNWDQFRPTVRVLSEGWSE